MMRELEVNRAEIVLLCGEGHSSRAVYNALRAKFGDILVILEESQSRLSMARRRAKRIGLIRVFGQMLFVGLVVPLLHKMSRARIAEIEQHYALNGDWGDANLSKVDSVNSQTTRNLLEAIQPRVVVVNGTRIIGKETLESVNAIFINTHAGITPLYRGVHGAYWALAEGRPDLVGTTVHLVDKGIDTGNIIEQGYFSPTAADNFATYPYLHTAAGIPMLLNAVENALEERLSSNNGRSELDSRLRYHPTLFAYLRNRILRGVK